MPNTVLVGAQWGDEGKGKIIDVLTEQADWIVRFQGGNNAGHTVEIGEQRYVLHLLPSGILHPGKRCVIGHGVVVDPLALRGEMEDLAARGVATAGRLWVSDRAHVIFPYHARLDSQSELRRARNELIGTTRRGIGPAYADKAARTGLRMGDLLDPALDDLLRPRLEEKNRILAALGAEPLPVAGVIAEYRRAAEFLAPYITDTLPLLHEAIGRGESLLLEGAQGTMLDIDYGTYPYVTSSNPTVGGVCTGAGLAPRHIDHVLGALKAYTTRVGEGPLPTELTDAAGAQLRERGREFGATTGRPRRCGWFDAVVARHAARLNGVDAWALTKLDVLDPFPVIRVAVAYEYRGRRLETVPANVHVLEECRPVYEDLAGWQTDTSAVTRPEDLPAQAGAYVAYIEKITGVPVGILSVGPRRASTMVVRPWGGRRG